MNTKQQEFDAVVAHLYKQGRPAQREDGGCMYRTEDGGMCAVGCRIPDSQYIPAMENKPFSRLMKDSSKELPGEFKAYSEMFSELQRVHDDWPTNDDGVYDTEYLNVRLPLAAENSNVVFTRPQ